MKRLCLGLLIAVSLVAFFSTAAPVSAVADPWPPCGEYEHTSYGELTHKNLTISYGTILKGGTSYDTVEFESHNGWLIYRTRVYVTGAYYNYTFPGGTTSHTQIMGGHHDHSEITHIVINLKKDCTSNTKCKPTEYYVYTLLGNYPCNLVTDESSIPVRFLNPEYTGPLCQLPELDHDWNGEWIANEVKNCSGYQVGGKYYDTSRPELP